VERLAERITDADAGVRGALRALLAGAVLPGLGEQALAPFLPLLMAHVSAAMTDLAAPVRCPPRRRRHSLSRTSQLGAFDYGSALGRPSSRTDLQRCCSLAL
jgi:hypothetical protein